MFLPISFRSPWCLPCQKVVGNPIDVKSLTTGIFLNQHINIINRNLITRFKRQAIIYKLTQIHHYNLLYKLKKPQAFTSLPPI